jgi:hypothetical protein
MGTILSFISNNDSLIQHAKSSSFRELGLTEGDLAASLVVLVGCHCRVKNFSASYSCPVVHLTCTKTSIEPVTSSRILESRRRTNGTLGGGARLGPPLRHYYILGAFLGV